MSRPAPLLVATDLHRHFAGTGDAPVRVLQGVNLEVQQGEFVAIVGESGSGKSTLLHLLGGLDRPDQGSVTFGGTDLFSRNDAQLAAFRNASIGFVFQFHHLLPEFTAAENVAMPALIAGRSPGKARPRALELLDQVGLSDRAGHRPSELSGGERQRVAVVRALMNDPELVLADEPTGNLDERTGAQLQETLSVLSRQFGKTFVVVTHSMGLAEHADRVMALEGGRLAGSTSHSRSHEVPPQA